MTGWFDGGADGAELALRAAFVSVLPGAGAGAAAAGDVVGGGVYLRDRYLLTCAHVVNAALGRDMFSMREPGPVRLAVAFAAAADRRPVVLSAQVSAWMPPRRRDGGRVQKGDVAWLGDLAVLELTAEPPESVLPQRWLEMTRDQRVRAWYGAGQAASAADTTVRVCEPPVAYLDAAATGPGIVGGYSGSPLWSYADQAVVGLAVGRLHSDGPAGRGYDDRTFAFSWQAIRTELRRELGADRAGRVLPPAQAAPVRRRIDGLSQLADLVRVLLPTEEERERSAQHLARQFGLPSGPQGTAPEPEQFAVLLLERPRALAALAEALAKHSADDAHRLLDLGRALAAPGLLSPGQHQWLLTVLDEVYEPAGHGRPALPSTEELLRAALPVVRVPAHLLATGGRPPEGFASRHAALVHHLEGYLGAPLSPLPGVRRVPLLLRFVEYLAAALAAGQPDAARKDRSERLRTWSGRVAQQLGVGEAALLERRAAAEEWAVGRPAGTTAGSSRVARLRGRRPVRPDQAELPARGVRAGRPPAGPADRRGRRADGHPDRPADGLLLAAECLPTSFPQPAVADPGVLAAAGRAAAGPEPGGLRAAPDGLAAVPRSGRPVAGRAHRPAGPAARIRPGRPGVRRGGRGDHRERCAGRPRRAAAGPLGTAGRPAPGPGQAVRPRPGALGERPGAVEQRRSGQHRPGAGVP